MSIKTILFPILYILILVIGNPENSCWIAYFLDVSCWISSWSLSCVVWSMMLWISLFLDSKVDEMLVYMVWFCILELILWSLGSICFLGSGWSCGELRRHNVTRQCDPQGGSGRLRRRRLIRRGRPPPSCGGVRRRTIIRWCVLPVLMAFWFQ